MRTFQVSHCREGVGAEMGDVVATWQAQSLKKVITRFCPQGSLKGPTFMSINGGTLLSPGFSLKPEAGLLVVVKFKSCLGLNEEYT